MAAADGNVALAAVAEPVPASVAAVAAEASGVGAAAALVMTLVALVPTTAMAAPLMAWWLWLPRAGELTVKIMPFLHAPLARDARTRNRSSV